MKGFTKIDNNILFSKELQPLSKLVLTSLTYYTRNGGGSCFARKTTLSRMLGISLYHLRKSLRELEQKHLIHIVRKGQGRPDNIYLNDFNSAIENPSSQHTIIEEELKKEEEDETIATEVAQQKQKKTYKTTAISQPAPPTTITLEPKHAPLTKTILNKIQTQIRPAGFEAFFKDAFVASDTDTVVEIFTPRGVHVAGWIKDHYLSMLKGVAGKQVKIISHEEKT